MYKKTSCSSRVNMYRGLGQGDEWMLHGKYPTFPNQSSNAYSFSNKKDAALWKQYVTVQLQCIQKKLKDDFSTIRFVLYYPEAPVFFIISSQELPTLRIEDIDSLWIYRELPFTVYFRVQVQKQLPDFENENDLMVWHAFLRKRFCSLRQSIFEFVQDTRLDIKADLWSRRLYVTSWTKRNNTFDRLCWDTLKPFLNKIPDGLQVEIIKDTWTKNSSIEEIRCPEAYENQITDFFDIK